MPKTLELIFKSNLDKPVKLQPPQFNAIIAEQLVKESMNQILELDILKSHVGKPIKAYAAQVIDRNTTVIFEDKK
ncbi:DUF2922 domain-containing protein [Staphylococcus saccharolyticus]|uniref:DUF2922 domain-containing protein n=1 Tax=Staphylococcus saccharolyticus TaxID=33028 RepID=UPI0032DFBCDC